MVAVVQGGDLGFGFSAFGKPSDDLLDYYQKSKSLFSMDAFKDTAFAKKATALYESAMGSDVIKAARMVIDKASSMFKRDVFCDMSTLFEIQNAMPQMQRVVMSTPEVRRLFNRQECDGYGQVYDKNNHVGIGVDDPMYRSLINHMVVMPESEDECVKITHYAKSDEEMALFSFREKVHGFKAHDLAKYFVQNGIDPTSQEGAFL